MTDKPHYKDLRDEFAMAALTGLCADPQVEGTGEEIANIAYELADAMMKVREDVNRPL